MQITAAAPEATFLRDDGSGRVFAFELAEGRAAVYSAKSPGKQEAPNEDAAAVVPLDGDAGVLAIADGMGGARAGERASQTALETLAASLTGGGEPADSLRSAIMGGIERANLAVQQLGIGAGTTLAIVELAGRTVRPYHVGDSLILVTGQRGKIKLLTVSHSPVGFAVEAGLLDEKEAIHHEHRHLISNVLGTADMRIEVGSTLELAPRDTLLLASDGLFDNLHIEEVIELIRKGPLERAVSRLAGEARRRMIEAEPGHPSKPDDLTIVAWRPAQHRTNAGTVSGEPTDER